MRPFHSQVPRHAVFLLGAFSLCGCQLLESLQGKGDQPSARVTGVSFQDLSLDSATLLFDVDVSNPYDVDIPLVNVAYKLASAGQGFVAGFAALEGSIPAGGSKVVGIPAQIVFRDLLNVLKQVKPGAVIPYTADLGLAVKVPVIGDLTLPVKTSGKLPVPTVPKVSLASVEWENLTLTEAAAQLDLRVVNRNDFPMDLSKLTYDLSLGNVSVAKGTLEQAASFEEGGETGVPIRVSFSPARLGLAAFNLLKGDGASYQIGGLLDVKTPFGGLELPYTQGGETEFKKGR